MAITYLLDTNACITHLRSQGTSRISQRIFTHRASEVVLCSIVTSELLFGAFRSKDIQTNLASVSEFIAAFRSIPFESQAAEVNARVRSDLENRGLRIGAFDTLIAAIAIANDLTLVTHNTTECSRIPLLRLQDWQ